MPQVSNVYKSTKQKNQFDSGWVEEYSKNIKFRLTDYVRYLQHRLKNGSFSSVINLSFLRDEMELMPQASYIFRKTLTQYIGYPLGVEYPMLPHLIHFKS